MSDRSDNSSVVIRFYTEELRSEIIKAVATLRQQTVQPQEVTGMINHNLTVVARA